MARIRRYYYPKGASRLQRKMFRSVQRRARVAAKWDTMNHHRKVEAANRRREKMEQFERDLAYQERLINIHQEAPTPVNWEEQLNFVAYNTSPMPNFTDQVERLSRLKNAWFMRFFPKWTKAVKRKMEEAERKAQERKTRFEREEASRRSDHEARERERIAYYQSIIQGTSTDNMQAELNHRLDDVQLPLSIGYTVSIPDTKTVHLSLSAPSIEALPTHRVSLTEKGNPSYRKKTPRQQYEDYTGFLCSSTIRMVQEVFSVLPSIPCPCTHVPSAWSR